MYRTRQALKSLQYSPKGQDIAGLPPQKQKDKQPTMMKDVSVMSSPFVIGRKAQQKRAKELCSDEKENPAKRMSMQTFNTVSIQCSKADEDMLCGDQSSSSPNNDYWRIMAYKRKIALNNVNEENRELHEIIETVNHENEMLREENKDLMVLLDEANSIKELVSEKSEGDSGVCDSTQ